MSWETVLDELTPPRLESLRKSWGLNPPLQQSVAAFVFGDKRPAHVEEKKKALIKTREDAERIMRMTGGKIPGMG